MVKKLLPFCLFLLVFNVNAQFTISSGGGPASVISAIAGAGLTVSNVSINCSSVSFGSFSGGAGSGMGISNGLAMSSGNLGLLPGGGNSNNDYSYCVGNSASDPQLMTLSSSATLDVCIIEFDVIPQCTNLGITFVFGSDEYTDFVNQIYNDAFGFFVSGPNPSGGSYSNINIATIPGGTTVSVDNVSHVTNTSYFVNNNFGTYGNHFDGFTTVLSPSIAVVPCQTYHFKLAIADASDCYMDSGVLIDIIQCNNITSLSMASTGSTSCGVNDGTATVTVTNGLAPLTYTWSPTPGGGQGTPNATGLVAGTTYTVTVDDPYTCLPPVTSTAFITGPIPPTLSVSSSSSCAGASNTLTASPSAGGGSYSWSPGGATSSSITVNPFSTTSYTCTYNLSGCIVSATGTVSINPSPTIASVLPTCNTSGSFNLAVDIGGGTWSGSGITNSAAGTFTPSSAGIGTNVITYVAPGGCTDTVHVIVGTGTNPSWNTTTLCEAAGSVNLNSFLTGTGGGTWSGAGVSGSTFNPAGLSGPVSISYSVGTAPCNSSLTQNITVISTANPAWNTTSACASGAAFNLDPLVTGTSGGSWSGTGVSGNVFNPSGLSGSIPVTYTVGSGSCMQTLTQNINVTSAPNPSWNTTSMCSDAAAINLDASVTGTPGGSWSGAGVSGSTFNPSGLSGGVSVTYTVGPVGCQGTSTQNITVTPAGNASWTATSLCSGSAAINLNTLITGTAGGTWSGTGVSGNMFDPAGLSGAISITYTAGTSPCLNSVTQSISVVSSATSTWNPTSVCSSDPVVNLDLLVTGDPGGTWSGTGVSGSSFNPSGLSGAISVTYTVGPAGCSSTSTQNMTVTPGGSAAWTAISICDNSAVVDLNTLLTGTSGGTWSGTGVSGNNFDPTGLSGGISVTYTVGTSPCISSVTQSISVVSSATSTWNPISVCSGDPVVNLDLLVTGDPGGTWSGTGVSGSSFNPSGLSGAISVTYTVGPAGCSSTSTQNMNVTPGASAAWTTISVCDNAGIVDLNTLLSGTAGGIWSGTGVSGNNFDPTGLSGSYAVTYSVGTSPCVAVLTQNITVAPIASAAWTPTTMCSNDGILDLNTLVTGSTGGTWSGTGVSGSNFDPTGLSGPISISYSVGTVPCGAASTQNMTVNPGVSSSITAVTPMCETTGSFLLSASAPGGTWSGTGITNTGTGLFDPTVATPGTYTISYVIPGACGDSSSVSITVLPQPSSAWAIPAIICANEGPVDLNALITGTTGGTFSGTGVSGNVFDPTGLSGNVTITYTIDQSGCTSTSSSTITVDSVSAGFTATPITGEAPLNVTTVNTSTNAVSYSWNFGNGDTSTVVAPSTVYSGIGNYNIVLIATSSNGCTDTAIISVNVEELSTLTVPNVFSPNGDGDNDFFQPIIAEGLSEFQGVIYNRWGMKLFEWTTEKSGWDGRTSSGVKLPDATYYYIVSGKGVDGKIYKYTGFVQLFN
ncbi:MAG: choice-of-anchor L domain-containing protein [Bacteroidota bacterium]|nr:choice-of-anchor L domain-containing protein [Bacteroidota bacterium]